MKMLKMEIMAGWRMVKAKRIGKRQVLKLQQMYKFLFITMVRELAVPIDVHTYPLPRQPRGPSATIDGWDEIRIPEDLRVHTRENLRRLFDGFQFPDKFVSKGRNVFSGEEVFLFGLYRLSHVSKYNQADVHTLFGLSDPGLASKCFHCFLNFMVTNWGYLLTNNLDFWLPYIPDCARAIARKCQEKGCYFPEDDFSIFSFIDNTMNACCRPGGVPTMEGEGAPRWHNYIQQAWYNGWKKLHGLKWQTVDLPNGMNFHVWGPFSVRHNDLYSLRHSDINDMVAALQVGRLVQYKIYGDSGYATSFHSHLRARHSYNDNTDREILENRVMSSCRESIEWNYGEVGRFWPLVDYKEVLQMRKMPVGAMVLTAMILRNALNTITPFQTSTYFHLNPPTLEQWLAQGPNARPNLDAVVPIPELDD
jgi:hypothetical protein